MSKDNTPHWNTQNNNNNDDDLARKLNDNIEIIERFGIDEALAFSARPLIYLSFPYSSTTADKSPVMTLTNGGLNISLMSSRGLPYGHYPRLILIWLTREALRRNAMGLSVDEARVIPLGDNLTQFMREIGVLKPGERLSGGKRGRIQTLRTQVDRLFSTTITINSIAEELSGRSVASWRNIPISSSGQYWWETRTGSIDFNADESYVELSADFFTELIQHAFPLNALHLAVIHTSPLAIDLYCWITYRLAIHRGFTRLTWRQLREQLSVGFADTPQGMRDFRKKVRLSLEKIKTVWPDMGVIEWAGGLELHGKNPAVPKQDNWFPDDQLPRF